MKNWANEDEVLAKQRHTELSEESLSRVVKDIQKLADAADKKIRAQPTTLIYKPSDIAAMGLTHEDLLKMVKDKNNDTEEPKYLYAYRMGNDVRLWHEPTYGTGFLGRIKLESDEE